MKKKIIKSFLVTLLILLFITGCDESSTDTNNSVSNETNNEINDENNTTIDGNTTGGDNTSGIDNTTNDGEEERIASMQVEFDGTIVNLYYDYRTYDLNYACILTDSVDDETE